MTASISIADFSFQNHTIRTLTEEDGSLWFVARDVCDALGISWRGNTLDSIPESWKGMRKFRTPSSEDNRGGGEQQIVTINEPAVYKLAFRSNKPAADAFTNWVASEVLPAIRQTGSYDRGVMAEMMPAHGISVVEFLHMSREDEEALARGIIHIAHDIDRDVARMVMELGRMQKQANKMINSLVALRPSLFTRLRVKTVIEQEG